MNPSTSAAKNAARIMRIVYGGILIHMILVIILGEFYLRFQTVSLDVNILIGIGILCFGMLGFVIFVRRKVVGSAAEALRRNPDDKKSIQKWKLGNLICCVILDVIVVFGLVIQITGENRRLELPFFIVGIGLMLLWWPKVI